MLLDVIHSQSVVESDQRTSQNSNIKQRENTTAEHSSTQSRKPNHHHHHRPVATSLPFLRDLAVDPAGSASDWSQGLPNPAPWARYEALSIESAVATHVPRDHRRTTAHHLDHTVVKHNLSQAPMDSMDNWSVFFCV